MTWHCVGHSIAVDIRAKMSVAGNCQESSIAGFAGSQDLIIAPRAGNTTIAVPRCRSTVRTMDNWYPHARRLSVPDREMSSGGKSKLFNIKDNFRTHTLAVCFPFHKPIYIALAYKKVSGLDRPKNKRSIPTIKDDYDVADVALFGYTGK